MVVVSFSVFGQKGKKKDQEDFEPLDVTSLSESDALKAETMVIEAERELILENYFKALELFKAVLEMDPRNAAVNFKVAEILTKNGDAQNALPYALQAKTLESSNKYYVLLTAEIYKSLSNFDEAAELYETLIEGVPGTESYLFDLAILYQYQGKFDKALETYQRAEEVFGMNEIVLREKQKIYLRKRDYESLIADWDRLIAENPEESRYTIELCEFLISQNLLDEARTRLEKVKYSKHADLLLSEIALVEGNTTKAMTLAKSTIESPEVDYKAKLQVLNNFLGYVITSEEFEELTDMAVKLAAQYPGKYDVQAFTGDVMFRLEKLDQARDYYMKALKISPSNFGVWQNVVNIEMQLGQYDSVAVHGEEALEYFPNQAVLYYFTGTAYLMTKEFKKSVQLLDQGKKYTTDPKLITVFYGQLGDAYYGMKQYEKSYDAYDQALKADPLNDHVLNNYSWYLSLRKEHLERALEMSSKLIQLYPDNATYLDTHGWVLYTRGSYEEALVFLRKAANMEEDGTVIEHYGDVLYQLGKVDDAVEQWKRASTKNDVSKNLDKKIADRKLYE